MKTFVIVVVILMVWSASIAQSPYPDSIQNVLNKAGGNKAELEKAIKHFSTAGDSLKLKAIYFLIANMDIHYSIDYYWANNREEKVFFDELSYPDFTTALKAFEEMKRLNPGLHPVQTKYYDIDTISSIYLIDNVESAFEVWKKSTFKKISFEDFCEYILPYRISMEPLQNWRKKYLKKFNWVNNDSVINKASKDKLSTIAKSCYQWFTNTYQIEERKEPLPRLGAMQLLSRKKGPCEDIADLNVFILRSQGIPATIDNIVCWATSSGKHFLNETLDDSGNPLSFDVSNTATMFDKLPREPTKVLRTTYSKQASALASAIDTTLIPPGILHRSNYVDVTREYWETCDVKAELFPDVSSSKVAYACVINFINWTPAWWGNVNDSKVVFTEMCKGAVFLPMSYENRKMKPVGWPIAVDYNNTRLLLKPDTSNLRSVSIYEQDKYLVFRPGKKYKLLFWNNKWTPIGEVIADANQKALVFAQVPRNALLLLIPEYSQRKERPFTISDSGERTWW
jgi:hypothetical protein